MTTAGVILGMVFFLIFRVNLIDSLKENYLDTLSQLQSLEINHEALMFKICKIRVVQMIVLFLCYLSKKRKQLFYMAVCMITCFGMMQAMCLFFLYSVKGFLIFLMLHFPQGFIYLLIFNFLLYKMENMGEDCKYLKNTGKGNKVLLMLGRLLEGVLLTTSCALGILMECYGNPVILKYSLKYLI